MRKYLSVKSCLLGGVLKYLVSNFTALNSRVGGTFADFLSLIVWK